MANRTTYLTNAYESTITAQMSSVASTMTLTSVTGLVAPFYVVIEPDNPSQREYVYVSALNGSIATVSERYLSGSAAGSGLTHPASSVVRMAAMSQHFTDINDRVDDALAQLATLGDHGSQTGLGDDDHTQYLRTDGARDMGGSFNPSAHTTYDMGYAGRAWDGIYTKELYDPTGAVRVTLQSRWLRGGDWSSDGGLWPTADDSYDLGSSGFGWAGVYARYIYSRTGAQRLDLDNRYLSGGDWLSSGSFGPGTDVAHDLGSSALTWRDIYAQKIYDEFGAQAVDISTRALSGGWTLAGALTPDSDNARDLGNATNSWRNLYLFELYDQNGTEVLDTDNAGGGPRLVGSWDISGHFLPSVDNVHQLGSAAYGWNALYLQNLYDSGGTLRFDVSGGHGGLTGLGDDDHPQYAKLTGAVFSGDIDPSTDNARDLGNATYSWRNLYAYDIYNESGEHVFGLNPLTFHRPSTGVRMFKMDIGGNGERIYGDDDTIWIEWDNTNKWFQFFIDSVEVLRLTSNGTMTTPQGTVQQA